MKKVNLFITGLGFIAMVLSSCGGAANNDESNESSENSNTSEPTSGHTGSSVESYPPLDESTPPTTYSIGDSELSKVTYKDDLYLPYESKLKSQITLIPDVNEAMINKIREEMGEEEYDGPFDAIFLKLDGTEYRREHYESAETANYPDGPAEPGLVFEMWAVKEIEGTTVTFNPIYKDATNKYNFNSVAYCYTEMVEEINALDTEEERYEYCTDVSNDLADLCSMRNYVDVFLNKGRAMTLIMPSAEVLNNYGSLLMHSGCKQEAIPYIENAVRLDPHNPVYLTNLAQIYFEYESYYGSSFDKTLEFCNRALAECPEFGPALQLLESVALEEDDYDLALKYMIRSAKTIWNDISIRRWASLYQNIMLTFMYAWLEMMYTYGYEDKINDIEVDFYNPITPYIEDLKEIANIQTGKGKSGQAYYEAPIKFEINSIFPGLIESAGYQLAGDHVNAINDLIRECEVHFDDIFSQMLGEEFNINELVNNLDSRALIMGLFIDQYYEYEIQIYLAKAENHNKSNLEDEADFYAQKYAEEQEAQGQAEDDYFYANIGHYLDEAYDNYDKYDETGDIKYWHAYLDLIDEYNRLLDKKKEIMLPVWKEELAMLERWYHESYTHAQAILDSYEELFDPFIRELASNCINDTIYICNCIINPAYTEAFILNAQYKIAKIDSAIYSAGAAAWSYVDLYRGAYESFKTWLEEIESEIEDDPIDSDIYEFPEEEFEGDEEEQEKKWNFELGLSVSAFGFSASISGDVKGKLSFGIDSPIYKVSADVNFAEYKVGVSTIHYGTGAVWANSAAATAEALKGAAAKTLPIMSYKQGTGYQRTFGLYGGTEVTNIGYIEYSVGIDNFGASAGANYTYDSKTASYVLDNVFVTGTYAGASFTAYN